MSRPRPRTRRLAIVLALLAALASTIRDGRAAPPATAPAGDGARYLAIYLPGVYFSQLERKLELGNDLTNFLASFLAERLGEGQRLTPRVYVSLDQLDADVEAGRVVLGLFEAPLIAMRLGTWTPVSVAATSSSETRLVVLAGPGVKTLAGLRSVKTVHASPLDKPQPFFDNFVFEGELTLRGDRLTATRDVASALSLISLKKAEAILLYEGDEALGQDIGLHALYRTTPLPRPTLVALDRRLSPADLQRLREVLAEFSGRQPGLRTFRATTEAPYQALRAHMDHRPKRVPLLIELTDENVAMPLPQRPAGQAGTAPATIYAPQVDPSP
jgi:hypothetical protein